MEEMLKKIYENGTVEIIISTPYAEVMEFVDVLHIEETETEFEINDDFTFKKEGASITENCIKWGCGNIFAQISIVY